MIIDFALEPFFSNATIQAHTTVFSLTAELYREVGEFAGPKMDEAIAKNFSPEIAAKLIGKEHRDRVDDEPIHWVSEDGHDIVDPGWFLFASEIDWTAGMVKADYVPEDSAIRELWFRSGEFLDLSEFERASYEVELFGLAFNHDAIEMMLPNAGVRLGTSIVESAAPKLQHNIGRPPKWDWEGALAHVIGEAQTPDGLPTGPGAQARIEELIADWFVEQSGNSPAASQIRQRASKIIKTLESPKTPLRG